jgi:hypothetical protein
MTAGSWDERDGLRRFWWILPPIVFALVTYAMLQVADMIRPETAQQVSDTVRRRVPADPRATVRIENYAGEVRVRMARDDEVDVRITRQGQVRGDEDRLSVLASLQIDVVSDGGIVDVRVQPAPGAPLAGLRANLDVAIPPEAAIEVHNGSGRVVIEFPGSVVTASTGRGVVDVVLDVEDTFEAVIRAPNFITNFPVDRHDLPAVRAAYVVGRGAVPRLRLELTSLQGEVVIRHD